MKIRHYLVSNSSSSSFILAIKPDSEDNINCKVKIEVDIMQYRDMVFRTVAELDSYIKSQEYPRIDDNDYDECVKAIESGKTIVLGTVDDECGDNVQRLIRDNIHNLKLPCDVISMSH